jgi:hypothetical protein
MLIVYGFSSLSVLGILTEKLKSFPHPSGTGGTLVLTVLSLKVVNPPGVMEGERPV